MSAINEAELYELIDKSMKVSVDSVDGHVS